MKYRNFRNIIALVAFASLGATCYGCYGCWQHALAVEQRTVESARANYEALRVENERNAAASALTDARRAASTAADAALLHRTPGAYWSQAPGLRPVDKDALLILDRPVVDKIKDASRGQPYKINAYSDDNKRFNRLKIDLDRDEKSDESWTIKEDGSIERKVASKDDESWDSSFKLDIKHGWVSLRAATPAAAAQAVASSPSAEASTPNGRRAVDEDMMSLIKGQAQEKVKDATKGKPYKINLYSDDGRRFNRAKVDLNRNDKWDESWTFGADGSVERQVAPADDENYRQVWVLHGTGWTQKR